MTEVRQGAPAELWQALLREAGERIGEPLDEPRESYLVFVLLRHQRDERLLARIQAMEWLYAQEQSGQVRRDALRDVGDRCLLIAGLYPNLAARRRVSTDYFIELGRSAYFGVADTGRSAYAALFEQLAQSYRVLVRTLRAVRKDAPPLLAPISATRH